MLNFHNMLKAKIIEKITEKLEAELEPMLRAAEAAHAAATHEESRAEDQHDTRGLEASYLAGAQAQRALELKQLISLFRLMHPRDFQASEPADLGAVIELEQGGRRSLYFLVQAGGGISIRSDDGKTIHVIAPKSLLGEELMGKRAGETFEIELEGQGGTREYEVIRLY
jgi:transcription elongation GreA/GreB family factor